MKITLLLSLLLSFSAHASAGFADISISKEKHISGRYVRKIISLSEDKKESPQFQKANESDGYRVEIERMVEGFGGPVLEKDIMQSKVTVGVGIEFTAGFTFTNTKLTKSLVEAQNFLSKNAIDYFHASEALKMEPEETAHFDFFAGMILAPEYSNFGIWAVATGGWDVNVTKKENDMVEIEFALVNSKEASFYFDKFAAMMSYDIGSDCEKGFSLTLNLKDPKARLAYERLFKGNALFAQTESLQNKNKNIVFNKRKSSSALYRGTGLWVRSPIVAWFLLNTTQHLKNSQETEFSYDKNTTENSLISSYEEDMELDLIGLYYGNNRSFSAAYNLSSKEFTIGDTYEMEGTNGRNVGNTLKQMLFKTRMNEYFDLNAPETENKFYHVKLEVKYSEDFLKHLISGHVDVEQLRLEAQKNITLFYDKKINAIYKENKPSSQESPYSLAQDKQIETQLAYIVANRIRLYSEKMQKAYVSSNFKELLENYALLMKYVYKSPAMYKAFVDYSKHCGTELNFIVENQAYASKGSQLITKKDAVCVP
jgi:hypothetical protein